METIAALSSTFDEMHRVAKGVTPAQLSNPTPCSEWDVRALLGHAFGVVTGLGAAAGGRAPAPFELDEGDIAGQFRRVADEALASWRSPGVLERELEGGAGPMPGAQYASINTLDTLVHAWDLARATGQQSDAPAELVEHTHAICQAIVTPEIRQFAGFDPAADAPANAPAIDRLAAFLGRRL
ncbi:MAG: TIGR03086 family metal-binding protein [Acidimicrobiales bacterium]